MAAVAKQPERTHEQRRRLSVRGVVQGVGFRPFVFRLASRYRIGGHVRNDGSGVLIEAQGPATTLDAFERALRAEAPPLARIDGIDTRTVPAQMPGDFEVLPSGPGHVVTAIGPDTGVCDACLREMFDPRERRWRYPLINCTHCGPRFTITRSLPYDRARTSMARFPMCTDCEREYRDVGDRRFHAEPIACPRCGPPLRWIDALPPAGAAMRAGDRRGTEAGEIAAGGGGPREADPRAVDPRDPDPVSAAVARLRTGVVVAIKGLGGFHLACEARDARAVSRLRERKQREEKPFAVLALNAASLSGVADIDSVDGELLAGPERPIVLLPKRPDCDAQLAGVAPGLHWLGAMLPYTPLHYLLFHEWLGRPAGTGWLEAPCPWLLVMTSANPHDEPLVCNDDEALHRLAGIADAMLTHGRDIVVRCDDTVVRSGSDRKPQFLRRARGQTPRAIALSRATPPVLATGGWLKNTVCLTRGDEAFVSQHIGDLDTAATRAFLEESVAHLRKVIAVEPAALAHDLHPDFHSSRFAAALADEMGLPRLAVQHHHAHVAAVLAEHRVDEPVVGLALDGVGLGTDGAAWGGELLWVDGARFERLGHLTALRLAGGDRAAREPWRMAASALHLIGRGDEIVERFADQPAAPTVATMLARGLRSPATPSLGRWFDAAAGLLGVRALSSFEGQAAMALEGLAATLALPRRTDALWRIDDDGTLDLRSLLVALADLGPAAPRAGERVPTQRAAWGAALFHATIGDALTAWAAAAARRRACTRVAAGGGCMLNALVSRRLRDGLAREGIELLEARAVPPNDGGLSLGQAWVAQRALFQGG